MCVKVDKRVYWISEIVVNNDLWYLHNDIVVHIFSVEIVLYWELRSTIRVLMIHLYSFLLTNYPEKNDIVILIKDIRFQWHFILKPNIVYGNILFTY